MLQGQGSGSIDQHALEQKEEQVLLTFGQKLVGLNFNPSNDDKVGKAKQLCADLADLLNDENVVRETSQFSQRIFSHAVCQILDAKMNVVNFLTLKY